MSVILFKFLIVVCVAWILSDIDHSKFKRIKKVTHGGGCDA